MKDTSKRIERIVQQMMNKGRIAPEELRGQLSEEIPGAMALFADAMGVSVDKLNEGLTSGTLLASYTLNKVAKKLEGSELTAHKLLFGHIKAALK